MAEDLDKDLLQQFAGVLADFGEWLAETLGAGGKLGQNRALKALVDDLGGSLKAGAPAYAPPASDGIKAYRDAAHPDLEAWFGLIADVRALVESLRVVVETAIDTGDAEATTEEIAQLLIDLLAGNYVRERWPHFHVWMEFARFSTEPMTLYGPHGSAAKRFAGSLKALLRFALAPLRSFCGPPMQSEADARQWSDATLLHFAGIFAFVSLTKKAGLAGTRSAREIGLDVAPLDETVIKMFYGWDQPAGALSEAQLAAPLADDISERMLSVQVRALSPTFDDGSTKVEGGLRFSLAWVPEEQGGKGLFVSLGAGTLGCSGAVGEKWMVQAKARCDAPFGVLIGGKEGFQVEGRDEAELHLDAAFMSRPAAPGKHGFRFSLGGGNAFEIGRIALSAVLDRDDSRAQISFHDCRLALDGAAFDDFIGSLLPSTQTSVEFSFGAGASSRDGVFTTGDLPFASGRGTAPRARALPRAGGGPDSAAESGLQPPDLPVVSTGLQGGGIPIQIPIGKSLGPVRLHEVLLNLDRDTSEEAPRTLIGAAVSFSGQIGPVLARVDRIGLKLALDFPEDASQANLHFANLDIGFLAPTGVGLAVDAKQVKGGGFLFYDEAKRQYGGVMELTLSGIIALKAIGLISTQLPDGSRGYSLLILITAESANDRTPLLELPMGWRLTGIGGLIAIHRTVDEEALRTGLKNRTLEAVLFPKDPVRNAATVIAAIDRVYPVRPGSYLLGLLVRLQWGVPTIITLDLGLIVEFGGRNRFVVLGRITSILPRLDHDLLRLNLDAVGIFDFDEGTAAIDAVLVDSRLLNRFPLTGGGALRARWTSPRSFALAVGGLHRGFTPPAGFPTLERIALSLTTGDNPRLTCQAYFALTANTVQFGAHAQLYAAAYGFSVLGEAGFDVLIRLLPFHFLAEFYAGMQLRKGSRNLFKVKVEGALEGPIPLALRAKCTFEIFWWDVSIRVNATLAGGEAPPLPEPVDAFAQLQAALADARSWAAELPPGQSCVVSLRESTDGAAVRVHPLGTLAVRQSVVPLNLGRDIDKFGESPVAGARRFTVTGVAVEGEDEMSSSSAVSDDFAPAQFFEMSDDARLASPSFETMQAGLRIGSPQFAFGYAERAESPLDYETRIIDRAAAVPPPAPTYDYRLSMNLVSLQARFGAAALSSLRRESRPVAEPLAIIEPVRYAAVSDPLEPPPPDQRALTFAEALAGLRGQRLILREFELGHRETLR